MNAYTLHTGDCLEVLKTLPDNSIDSVVTDPPYGLSDHRPVDVIDCLSAWLKSEAYCPNKRGFMGQTWDAWVPGPEVWKEAFRVLKPGGHIAVFAGSRTHDLMAIALRLSGFEFRETLMWVYSQGFPKSLNVSKAIDKAGGGMGGYGDKKPNAHSRGSHSSHEGWKRPLQNDPEAINNSGREYLPELDAARQWQGWGTALKPAFEPILLFRKPLEGTVANNVLKHGTGAINIDACRVPLDPEADASQLRTMARNERNSDDGWGMSSLPGSDTKVQVVQEAGRFPANVLHDGSEEVLALFPHSASGAMKQGTQRAAQDRPGSVCYGVLGGNITTNDIPKSEGSAARFFYCAKISRKDRHEGLTDPGPQFKHNATLRQVENTETAGNKHPTVKPTQLMRWLVRLITPPGGIVLDPFMGSGSTGKAAVLEGMRFTGIEQNPTWVAVATARINHCLPSPPDTSQPMAYAS